MEQKHVYVFIIVLIYDDIRCFNASGFCPSSPKPYTTRRPKPKSFFAFFISLWRAKIKNIKLVCRDFFRYFKISGHQGNFATTYNSVSEILVVAKVVFYSTVNHDHPVA